MSTTSELELLEGARRYDAQALAEIYDRYAESIYGYLYRTLGDAAEAEDLTGEVFLRLLQVLPTRRAPRDRLQGWLYRVAHNLAMDRFRQQSKGTAVSLEEDWIPGRDTPSAEVEDHQRQQQLRAAIGGLTSDQQQVIVLRFGQGLKLAEVGQLMGKSEGAVKTLQHRAINRLRKLLDRGS